MLKGHYVTIIVLTALVLISGCRTDSTLEMGDKIVGVRSGRLIFIDRALITEYNASFDAVWAACEKTLVELKAFDIRRERRIASGSLKAVVADEKVLIMVDYAATDRTSVSIMIGDMGNSLASQLFHEKIAHNLAKTTLKEAK